MSTAFDVFMVLSFDKNCLFAWKWASIEYFTNHDLFFQLKGRYRTFDLAELSFWIVNLGQLVRWESDRFNQVPFSSEEVKL